MSQLLTTVLGKIHAQTWSSGQVNYHGGLPLLQPITMQCITEPSQQLQTEMLVNGLPLCSTLMMHNQNNRHYSGFVVQLVSFLCSLSR
jgi:hypothetical protein